MPKRNGRELKTLTPGDRRRMSDGRNAFRKMTPEQRIEFLRWIADELPGDAVMEGYRNESLALASDDITAAAQCLHGGRP